MVVSEVLKVQVVEVRIHKVNVKDGENWSRNDVYEETPKDARGAVLIPACAGQCLHA